MSRGWEAVSRIGEGLLARGERKRQLEDERKYLAEQAAIEEERALEKAKVLQQLKDDNKAAAEAAKAAREQVLNLGDGQVGIYSNDPDGKIRFRTEGERKPNLKYLSTDEGLLEYDPATGSRKRIAGLPPRAPAAWNDPSTIVRDLDEEWSRVRTQLDTKIGDIQAAMADPVEGVIKKQALQLQLENAIKVRDERKAEIDKRKASVMGQGEGLMGIASYPDGGTVEYTGPENEDDAAVLSSAGTKLPTPGAVYKLGDNTPPRPKAEEAKTPKDEAKRRAAVEQTMGFKKELGALIAEQKRLGTKYTVEQLKELAHNNLDAE